MPREATQATGDERRRASAIREVVLRKGARRPEVRTGALPDGGEGLVLARSLLTGVDGTDEELLSGEHAAFPEDADHLVLGHEALAEVVEAPEGVGLEAGDLVVPLVRRGCGRCNRCLYGASDLCETMDFQEHGIKGLHGFMRDLWRHDARGLVRAPRDLGDLAVLTEPLSVCVKALEEATRFQARLPWFEEEGRWQGKRAFVAGVGSLGALAAFLLRHEGMDVWAMDRSGHDAASARLLRAIGAAHVDAREDDVRALARDVDGFDLVVEGTGAPRVMFDALPTLANDGVMALLGVPPGQDPFRVDGDDVMRRMVTRNQIVFGSVNSRRAHFEESMRRLQAFQRRWPGALDRVLTHTFRPEQAAEAFEADGDDLVKKAIDWRDDARLRRP